MLNEREQRTGILVNCGVFFVILTCFSIPLSTSLMGLSSSLVLLFWILSGRFFKLPQLLSTSPVALLSFILFILFIVGMSYSPVSYEESFKTLLKYRELLLIPAVISLMQGNRKGIQAAKDGFVTGCILLLLISYGIYFSIIPSERYGCSILYHITHSFFMAVLAFWTAHRAFDSKQYQYFWIIIFLLTAGNLIYVTPGRTGMLIFILLMLLLVIQRLSWKQQLIGLFILSSLFSTAYFASENVSTRLNNGWTEIKNYKHGKARTSLGQRLDWYTNSIDLLKQKPFFGHGTGSFMIVQKKVVESRVTKKTDNPHNEYLFIGVQLGWVGLTIFLLLLGIQWIQSFNLSSRNKWLAQGIILSMATGCTMNSFLFDAHQGHYFALLTGIFFSIIRHPHPSLTFR